MCSIVKKKKKIKLLLSRVLNINLLINPKKEREREKIQARRKLRRNNSFPNEILFKTRRTPFKKSRITGINAKAYQRTGPHTHPLPPLLLFFSKTAEIGSVEKGPRYRFRDPIAFQSWMARCFFFPLPPLCIGNCLRCG